jgi:hypothetical protein
MFTHFSFQLSGRGLLAASLGICLLLLAGCGSEPFSNGSGLYDDAPCQPAEFVSQLRKALSRQNVRTTEPTADGRGLVLFADSVVHGYRRERLVRYRLLVLPVENANKSTISLQLVDVESQGLREKAPYKEENTTSIPEVEQQILGQVQTICRSGQPQ